MHRRAAAIPVTWVFNFVALWVAAALLSGIDYDGIEVLIVASLVFSIVNIFVRPLVILFTLPLVIMTLGIALFFINLLMLYLTSWIVDDFTIDSFWWAVLATIIVWLVNAILEAFFGDDLRDRRAAPGRRWTAATDHGRRSDAAARCPAVLRCAPSYRGDGRATRVPALAAIACSPRGCGGGGRRASKPNVTRTRPTWRSRPT